MVCLNRPYPFKFFKGYLPQILLGPLLEHYVPKNGPTKEFLIFFLQFYCKIFFK